MIIIVLLLLGFAPLTTAEGVMEPMSHFCNSCRGNYTAKSTYQANLELLAAALPTNASSTPTLYAKGSIGTGPDTIYGLALCRGDTTNASACRECVDAMFQDARVLCAFRKDVTLFAEFCTLRFSSQDFITGQYLIGTGGKALIATKLMNISEPMLPGWDPDNAESVDVIKGLIMVLLQETAKYAAYASPTRYATGRMDVSSTFPTLYSLVQCTPDLLPRQCWDCVQEIISRGIKFFNGTRGGRASQVRCSLRYEAELFYYGQPMRLIGSPHAADPSEKHKRWKIKVLLIATVIPLLASAICFIFCFGLIRGHRKGKASLQGKPNINFYEDEIAWTIEGTNSEYTVFDFSQVSEATSDFSNENKLGQGGFGSVYKGQLPDGREIAIKRLASHLGQGFTEFRTEIQLIAKLQHTNLVRLLGCCSQGDEKNTDLRIFAE